MNIYHISKEHEAILRSIEEQEGEVTDEQMEALTVNEESLKVGIASMGGMVECLNDRVAALKVRKQAVDGEIKKLTAYADRMRDRMLYYMQQYGVKEIKTDDCKISVKESTTVDVPYPETLPEEYQRMKVEADKVKIRKAIENGESIMGATISSTPEVKIKML